MVILEYESHTISAGPLLALQGFDKKQASLRADMFNTDLNPNPRTSQNFTITILRLDKNLNTQIPSWILQCLQQLQPELDRPRH